MQRHFQARKEPSKTHTEHNVEHIYFFLARDKKKYKEICAYIICALGVTLQQMEQNQHKPSLDKEKLSLKKPQDPSFFTKHPSNSCQSMAEGREE